MKKALARLPGCGSLYQVRALVLRCCAQFLLPDAPDSSLPRLLPNPAAGKSPADASVVVSLASGLETRAFVDKDGYAQLRGLPPGSHLLNVFVMGELYPEVSEAGGRLCSD